MKDPQNVSKSIFKILINKRQQIPFCLKKYTLSQLDHSLHTFLLGTHFMLGTVIGRLQYSDKKGKGTAFKRSQYRKNNIMIIIECNKYFNVKHSHPVWKHIILCIFEYIINKYVYCLCLQNLRPPLSIYQMLWDHQEGCSQLLRRKTGEMLEYFAKEVMLELRSMMEESGEHRKWREHFLVERMIGKRDKRMHQASGNCLEVTLYGLSTECLH